MMGRSIRVGDEIAAPDGSKLNPAFTEQQSLLLRTVSDQSPREAPYSFPCESVPFPFEIRVKILLPFG